MSKLAKKIRARRRRYKANPSTPKANPPPLGEIAEYVVPGFGGFVATKLATRLVTSQVAARWPQHAKKAAIGTTVAAFLGAWFLGNKWKWLARWHTPVVVGSGLAALQSMVSILFPDKLAWLVGDSPLVIGAGPQQTATQAQQIATAMQGTAPALPSHLEELTNEDPQWYSFRDTRDPGLYANQPSTTPAEARQTTTAADAPVDDLSDIMSDTVFSGGLAGN